MLVIGPQTPEDTTAREPVFTISRYASVRGHVCFHAGQESVTFTFELEHFAFGDQDGLSGQVLHIFLYLRKNKKNLHNCNELTFCPFATDAFFLFGTQTMCSIRFGMEKGRIE